MDEPDKGADGSISRTRRRLHRETAQARPRWDVHRTASAAYWPTLLWLRVFVPVHLVQPLPGRPAAASTHASGQPSQWRRKPPIRVLEAIQDVRPSYSP